MAGVRRDRQCNGGYQDGGLDGEEDEAFHGGYHLHGYASPSAFAVISGPLASSSSGWFVRKMAKIFPA
jgi:hypothetical protein